MLPCCYHANPAIASQQRTVGNWWLFIHIGCLNFRGASRGSNSKVELNFFLVGIWTRDSHAAVRRASNKLRLPQTNFTWYFPCPPLVIFKVPGVAASQPASGWPWDSSARHLHLTLLPPHTWVPDRSNQHSNHADGQPDSVFHFPVLYIYLLCVPNKLVYTGPLLLYL